MFSAYIYMYIYIYTYIYIYIYVYGCYEQYALYTYSMYCIA